MRLHVIYTPRNVMFWTCFERVPYAVLFGLTFRVVAVNHRRKHFKHLRLTKKKILKTYYALLSWIVFVNHFYSALIIFPLCYYFKRALSRYSLVSLGSERHAPHRAKRGHSQIWDSFLPSKSWSLPV